MSIYMTNPKYELVASAAYTTDLDEPDASVTLAINKCGMIVACRNNANDVEIVEGILRVCHDDEALIEAAKAFAEELDAAGYEGYAKWLRMEIKQAELVVSGEE